jgi:hypothetical protein
MVTFVPLAPISCPDYYRYQKLPTFTHPRPSQPNPPDINLNQIKVTMVTFVTMVTLATTFALPSEGK